jgi:ParB family chromosome partitioning protein
MNPKMSKLDKMMLAGKGSALKVSEAPSSTSKEAEFGLKEIPLYLIDENPRQTRLSMNEKELQELSESIAKGGLIQPISVLKNGDRFVLRAGQRRLAAHKILGLETIKAIIEDTDSSEKSLFETSIIENAHRENVDPLELAISFDKALKDGFYSTQSELAMAIGKTEGLVSQYLSILKLADPIKQKLATREVRVGVKDLYLLQKIKDATKQIEIFEQLVSSTLSSLDLQITVKHLIEAPVQSVKTQYWDVKKKVLKLKLDVKKEGKEETLKILKGLIQEIERL